MFSFRRVFLFFLAGGKQVLPNLSISLSPRCTPCSVFVRLSSVLPVSEVLFVVWLWLRLRWEASQDRCVGCGDARKPTVWQMLLRPASSASGGGVRPQKHTQQGNRSRSVTAECIHPTLHKPTAALSTVWGLQFKHYYIQTSRVLPRIQFNATQKLANNIKQK